ncbi:MAG: hypothetical protein FK733_03220 [Asgard group archaeon]|nr:hypothetical protein [Asgard group archaeon]
MTFKSRKQLLISSVIILALIFNSTIISHKSTADWTMPNSDVDYILEESEWTVEYNDVTVSTNSGYYNGLMVKELGVFTVDVIDIDEQWGVDYNVDNSTHDVNDYITSDKFFFEFLKFLYYPLDESKHLVETGLNETRVSMGFNILPWFFIETSEETWNYLANMSDINYHNLLPIVKNIEGSLRGDFVKAESEATFDIMIQGTVENSTLNINYNFDHTLKFVWNALTGVLLGYRISSYFSGTYSGFTISEQINVVCKQVGYALEGFRFIAGFLPGYSFTISLIGLTIIAISFIVIKQLRRKREK